MQYVDPAAQPVEVVTAKVADPATTVAATPAPPPVSDDGMQSFQQARAAFYDGDYPKAMTLVNTALSKMPNDAVLHEFRALVLFAQKQYKESAGTIYSILAVGPGWDWTTLAGLYPNIDIFTAQLRELEEFTRANQTSADGHFLLAYFYMTMGHNDAAKVELQAVLKLLPGDTVASQLLQVVSPPGTEATATANTTPQQPPAAPPADASELPELAGQWKATRPDGSTFTLSFGDESKFVWEFSKKGKNEKTEGTYTMADGTLVLQASSENMLVGKISPEGNGFRLILMGGPPGDKGLVFKKA